MLGCPLSSNLPLRPFSSGSLGSCMNFGRQVALTSFFDTLGFVEFEGLISACSARAFLRSATPFLDLRRNSELLNCRSSGHGNGRRTGSFSGSVSRQPFSRNCPPAEGSPSGSALASRRSRAIQSMPSPPSTFLAIQMATCNAWLLNGLNPRAIMPTGTAIPAGSSPSRPTAIWSGASANGDGGSHPHAATHASH